MRLHSKLLREGEAGGEPIVQRLRIGGSLRRMIRREGSKERRFTG